MSRGANVSVLAVVEIGCDRARIAANAATIASVYCAALNAAFHHALRVRRSESDRRGDLRQHGERRARQQERGEHERGGGRDVLRVGAKRHTNWIELTDDDEHDQHRDRGGDRADLGNGAAGERPRRGDASEDAYLGDVAIDRGSRTDCHGECRAGK